MKVAARLLLILALVAPAFASAQVQTAPAPTCRLFSSATVVNYNTKVRLDWDSNNATGGYLTDVGTIPPSGSSYVVPGKNTTYAASFTGPGGTVVCRTTIAVRSGGAGGSYSGSAPDVNINTNVPVNLDRAVNLGSKAALPAAPSVSPGTAAQNSSSGFTGGIVPAECRGTSVTANCDLCSLAQLGQNVANFLLGVSIPAAALLFAWAGILYFSARGNTGQIEKAHKVFRSVVIGFVIAISAWVLVITVMNMLIQGGDIKSWNWSTLSCADTRKARLYNVSLSTYLASSLPVLQTYSGGKTAYQCQTGTLQGAVCVDSDGNTIGEPLLYSAAGTNLGCGQYSAYGGHANLVGTQCVGDDNTVLGPALRPNQVLLSDAQQDALQNRCEEDGDATACTVLDSYLETGYSGGASLTKAQKDDLQRSCKDDGDQDSCDLLAAYLKVPAAPSQQGVGNCSAQALASSWGNAAAGMSCITNAESSCNPNLASGVDKGADNQPFSWGVYQLNLNANYLQCDGFNGGQKVNCPAAFTGHNFKGRVTDQELYNQCVEMAKNVPCATQNAQRLYSQSGFRPWTTHTKCGI